MISFQASIEGVSRQISRLHSIKVEKSSRRHPQIQSEQELRAFGSNFRRTGARSHLDNFFVYKIPLDSVLWDIP